MSWPKDAPRRGRTDSWITRGRSRAAGGSRWWSRVSASRGRLDLGELMSSGEKPRNAEPPRRGGLSSGLAAALDEYEHAPHGDSMVGRPGIAWQRISQACSPCETAVPR